jgi:hypothetical protein
VTVRSIRCLIVLVLDSGLGGVARDACSGKVQLGKCILTLLSRGTACKIPRVQGLSAPATACKSVLLLVLCKDPEAVSGAAAFCGPGLLLSTAWLRSPSAQRDCASEIVQRGCTPVY